MEKQAKEGKKKQLLTLIIGILIGAILSSVFFLIFKPKNSRNIPDFSGINSGEFDRSKMRSKINSDDTETKEETKLEENTNEKQN